VVGGERIEEGLPMWGERWGCGVHGGLVVGVGRGWTESSAGGGGRWVRRL